MCQLSSKEARLLWVMEDLEEYEQPVVYRYVRQLHWPEFITPGPLPSKLGARLVPQNRKYHLG